MNEQVVAFDIGRLLLGDEPPLFLLEIALRTVIIYGYTLALVRWLGGRSIGQLSMVEFLLVIALGSAVGDAMFYADVPLIHAMIVITIVVLLDKALSFLVTSSSRLEDLIEGKTAEVVRDGVIQWRELQRLQLGHDELYEQLRLKEVSQLGQVRCAFFEANGLISVFKKPDGEPPGLAIVPPWDVAKPRQYSAGEAAAEDGAGFACIRCATVVRPAGGTLPPCPNCHGETWHEARR